MSWSDYICNLLDKNCQDAAIVGYCGTPSVWACHPGGTLGKITAAEVLMIVCENRDPLFINGVTVGGLKCSVIRDQLMNPDVYILDLKSKSLDGGPTFNIAVAKTKTALVIVMGAEGVHGGCIHTKAADMAKYLRDSNV
ncbi:profilin-1-like [Discoglossus pictus]